MRRVVVCLQLVLVAVAGCTHPRSVAAARPACTAGSIASWSTDSAVAICLPASFTPVPGARSGHVRWVRGDVQSPSRAWLSISIDTARVPDEPWPPHLASRASCFADCASADSVAQHRDTLTTGIALVETGLVSGGLPGFRRQPFLVAGWPLPTGGRVWVNGFVNEAPTLDTLRRALRTVQLREF